MAARLALCLGCSDGFGWEDQTPRYITERLETGFSLTHMFHVPDEFPRSVDYGDIFFKDLEGTM